MTAILSVMLILLMLTLLKCADLYYDREKYKRRAELYDRMQKSYLRQLSVYEAAFREMQNSPSQKYNEEVLEAIHYAMKKAHPDNRDGNQADFIKFNKLYNSLRKK